jgi:hypothetical protein
MESEPAVLEMELSLPHDVRLAAAIRSLAVQAAHFAGCDDARAETFAQSVEAVVRSHLESIAEPNVPVIVRLTAEPLQIQIASRVISLDR